MTAATSQHRACVGDGVNPDWWDTAATRADQEHARDLCQACPFRGLCLLDALAERPNGVIRAGLRWTKHGTPKPFPTPRRT